MRLSVVKTHEIVRDGKTISYSFTKVREDVAKELESISKELIDRGGVGLTSSGGLRYLSASTKGRSSKSFHYPGLAHDLAIYSAMRDPYTDPYLVSFDYEKSDSSKFYWRVYAKVEDGVKFTSIPWVYRNVSIGAVPVESWDMNSKVVDLTYMFESRGFIRVSSRSEYKSKNIYTGIEWWHYQFVKPLVLEKSTFGEELLRIYPLNILIQYPNIWKNKNCVFGKDWN